MPMHPSHAGCVVCRDRADGGLGMQFAQHPDGRVIGSFACDAAYQGYADRLHGGITAMLVDGAMTHSLFARGISAVTAKLEITYRHPIQLGKPAEVRAWIERSCTSHFALKADIRQDQSTCVTAQGLFVPLDLETGLCQGSKG